MDKKEMIQAMINGNTLEIGDFEAYYDKDKSSPFRFKSPLKAIDEELLDWRYYWRIKEEPIQIINRFELMNQIMNRRSKGEKFLVRETDGIYNDWVIPETLIYKSNELYEWTKIDDDGYPIGNPQKFVK